MSKKERVTILVDGSNMYHYLKGLGLSRLLELDYKAFAEFLARDRQIVSAGYYVGKIRVKDNSVKSKELFSQQRRLTSRLQNFGWEVKYGHMLKNKGVFHEKGVDVHLAADLLRGAYKDLYDTAILVSSDTDLIPAVQYLREEGKKLEYVGFGNRPSYGLIKNADIITILKKEEVAQFLPH